MFYKKRLLFSLLIAFGIFTFFIDAVEPPRPTSVMSIVKLDDSNRSIRVSIIDNFNNEDEFYVYFYPKDATILAVFPPLVPSKIMKRDNSGFLYADIKGLLCDTTYKIFILGKNSDNRYYFVSNPTRFINIRDDFNATCSTPVPIATPGPYIGVTDINKTAVRISFLDNSYNENGFRIYDEANNIDINISGNDENEHAYVYKNITGLVCNKMYTIKIVAYNNSSTSNVSDARSFNIHTTFDIACSD